MDKQELVQRSAAILSTLYYEDVEFFYNFVSRFARKVSTRRKGALHRG